MNTEYVWWVVVLLIVGGGAIAFLALGQVPEIGDGPALPDEPAIGAEDQRVPVRTTVPGPDEPFSTSETP